MAKTRDAGKVPPTKGSGRKTRDVKKILKKTHTTQGVIKVTRSKGGSTPPKAAKKAAGKPKADKGRLRKVRVGEELEAQTKEYPLAVIVYLEMWPVHANKEHQALVFWQND